MDESAAPLCHNPEMFGCSDCRALRSEYFERVNDFIRLASELDKWNPEAQLERAVWNARDAINGALADLSAHQELEHSAALVDLNPMTARAQ